DAVLHRADLGADPAPDAGFVDDLVVALWRDLEALVGAVEPAHRAFDAGIEVDDRPERARAVLLVVRVALAGLARVDDDSGAHRGPAGLLELQDLVAARALADLHLAHRGRVVPDLDRGDRGLVALRELRRRGL